MFTLPTEAYGRMWQVVVDTAEPAAGAGRPQGARRQARGRLRIPDRSLLVLQRRF